MKVRDPLDLQVAQPGEAAIELLVKALVLVFAYLMLIISLLDMVIMWSLIVISFTILDFFILGASLSAYLFGFSYIDDNIFFKYEESIQWRYFGFLDLDLPVIRTETWFNQQLSWEESDIISGTIFYTISTEFY
ncbi:MAG: hypothetical protein Q6373_007035 [Candidatus Sigynarchaeota archaeon]